MTKFRSAISPWALPLVGLWLIVTGIIVVFSVPVNTVVAILLGILAIVAGVACLFAS